MNVNKMGMQSLNLKRNEHDIILNHKQFVCYSIIDSNNINVLIFCNSMIYVIV